MPLPLGFWNALREVFPEAREGRCWFHKTANVLAALPKSAHPGAKKALAEIWGAEDKDHALAAVEAFEVAYGGKFPKAAAKITDDVDEMLAFYDYPAEHWDICGPPTRSNRPSPPSGTERRSPRGRALPQPLGPNTATVSPRMTSWSTPLTAWTRLESLP